MYICTVHKVGDPLPCEGNKQILMPNVFDFILKMFELCTRSLEQSLLRVHWSGPFCINHVYSCSPQGRRPLSREENKQILMPNYFILKMPSTFRYFLHTLKLLTLHIPKAAFINYDLGVRRFSRGNTLKKWPPLQEYPKNKWPPYGNPVKNGKPPPPPRLPNLMCIVQLVTGCTVLMGDARGKS